MRTIYRTSFEIRAAAPADDLFQRFSEFAWLWLYDRRGVGLANRPAAARGPVSLGAFSASQGFDVETLQVEVDGRRGWGLILRQQDSHDPGLVWTSDLALLRADDGKHYFSFTQSIGRQDGGMIPIRRTPGRPRIIATLIREFPSHSGGLRLFTKPLSLRLSDHDLRQFIALLERPARTHPIVLVSTHVQSGAPLIKPGELADHLSGIAHVIVTENAAVCAALSALMPRWLTCFDGAIRVYWPGFRRASRTVDHRLWTTADLADPRIQFDSGRFADLVLEQIAEVSVNSTSPNYCSFDRLQSLDRRRVIANARNNQDWEQLANAYATEVDAKEGQIAELERELQTTSESLFREQQLTVTLKAALEERKAGRASGLEEQLPIDSVAHAVARAGQDFSDKIIFSLNGKSDEHSPFDAPGEVFAAFEWLSTAYRDSKLGVKSCADLDKSVRELIPGWHYSGHQNDSTARSHRSKDWYQCPWPSSRTGKLDIHEHLKCGRSRDAEETIRVAFAWDEPSQKVVIGFIGQHQKNTKT